MKRKHIFIVLLITIILILSCGENKNTPEYVARQYLQALKDKNWERAKKYTTKENAQNLDMVAKLGVDFGMKEIKDLKCDTRQDQAVCTFCCADSNFTCLDLLKREGKWTVILPKDEGCHYTPESDSILLP